MSKLAKHFRPYILPALVMLVFIFGQVSASLALPDYMARIVNEGIIAGDTGVVWHTGLRMLIVALLGGGCMVVVGFLASRIATGFTRRVRDDLFATVEGFSLIEFNRFSTASLITRCTNDLQQIQTVLVLVLRLALMAPIMGIGAIIKAERLAPSMTWIMAIGIGALLVIIVALFATAIPRFTRLQQLVDRLNLVTREILTGLRVVRAYNRQDFEQHKFAAANRELTGANLFVNRLTGLMQPAMMLVLNLTSIAVVWVGAHRIEANRLQIGDMLAFMQYAMQAMFAFLMISMIFVMVPRAIVSARRAAEVLAAEPAIIDPAAAVVATTRAGTIEFRNVTFAYPGAEEPVLQDVSFTARPGETTAIVGSTGSGKSTLIALVPRFYDVTAGQVLVDGVDVRDTRQSELRARIGYVPQRAMLFTGTVGANIRYGDDAASEARVRTALEIAQAVEFVDAFAAGLDEPIAQGGLNVSGGQRQRLSIARAIVRDPEILLFDDSFSALDFATDARLRQALRAETRDKTVLIVAQRISTIMDADKIVVLEAGKVVGEGRHRELLVTSPVYREIAASQLSESELAQANGHLPASVIAEGGV